MVAKKEKIPGFMDIVKEYEFDDVYDDIIEHAIMLLNAKKVIWKARNNMIKQSDEMVVRIDNFLIALEKAFTNEDATAAKEVLGQINIVRL